MPRGSAPLVFDDESRRSFLTKRTTKKETKKSILENVKKDVGFVIVTKTFYIMIKYP